MAARKRPTGCCSPKPVRSLASGRREALARVAKALSDPNRIEMLRLIAAQAAPVCACDVVEYFDLSQPTISHHLKTLTGAGLLRDERKGLWVFYEVGPEAPALLDRFTGLLTPATNRG